MATYNDTWEKGLQSILSETETNIATLKVGASRFNLLRFSFNFYRITFKDIPVLLSFTLLPRLASDPIMQYCAALRRTVLVNMLVTTKRKEKLIYGDNKVNRITWIYRSGMKKPGSEDGCRYLGNGRIRKIIKVNLHIQDPISIGLQFLASCQLIENF